MYEDLRFTHLNTADGLSHSDLRAIVQDRQGFLWFGTWRGGLDRYDGYDFKVYKHDPDNDRSIASDGTAALYVDHNGVLWVGTSDRGLDRHDRESDSFVHYPHRSGDPTSLSHDVIKALYEDEHGVLWVGTVGGLSCFDPRRNAFRNYLYAPDAPDQFIGGIWTICLDRNMGLLWVGTSGDGVCVVNRSSGRFKRYVTHADDPTSLSHNFVMNICQDRAGTLWISTHGGLNRFDPGTNTFVRYLHDSHNPSSISDDYVVGTYEDRTGRLWVSTNNGINLMDRARGTFTRFLNNPNDPGSLSSNTISRNAVFEDASGAVWIGTRSTGGDRVPGEAAKFIAYRHIAQDADSLGNNLVRGLCVDASGQLWAATDGGLDRFDGRRFVHYVNDPDNPLNTGPLRVVAQDAHGAIWTGTYGGGLCRLDGDRFTHFHHDPDNPDSPANDTVTRLVPDREGGMWIGLDSHGLDYFDGRRFTHFPANPTKPDGLANAWVHPALLDRHGMLWITTRGLIRLDTKTRKFSIYYPDPAHPENELTNYTNDVYSDDEALWVASSTGLFRFDPVKCVFTHHYTEKDGLASNFTMSVVGDSNGFLWIGTTNGLSRFDPRTQTFRNFDRFDGLPGSQFSNFSCARAPDGRLFFGGVDGLSAFYPDAMVDNPTPPPVVLTDFTLFNQPVEIGGKGSPLKQAIDVAKSITLRHDQSVIRLQFAALNYTAPEKNRYAYKLEGFDSDWRYTDATRRFATYTNLNPGGYTFRVKASNNDGVWNEQGAALTITVTPPWWATKGFRGAVAAGFVALTYSGYRLRVRSMEVRARELERQVAERTEELAESNRQLEVTRDYALQAQQAAEAASRAKSTFLANMSHELRTPLNAVLGFSQILKTAPDVTRSQMESLDIITRSGQHLLRLINDVLDLSKIEAGRMELEESYYDLHQLLHEVKSLMYVRAIEKGLEFEVEQSGDLPRYVSIDSVKLRQVLVNLVGNAIKHTPSGRVVLRALSTEEADDDRMRVCYEVEDSGPGISPEDRERIFQPFVQLPGQPAKEAGTGLGLAISKQYAELMGGRIWVGGEPGQGAVFFFEVPVTRIEAEGIPAASGAGRVVGVEPGQPRYRLLIAEDQPQNRLLLRKLLDPLGFDLREAENGLEAVAIYEEWHPDLVLMDIRMPVMDGLEAARRIKSMDADRQTRIVAITAHAMEDERREILAAGCDEFIRKPYEFDQIFETLSALLGVHWIYEEEAPPASETPLNAAALARLPVDLIDALEHAVARLDVNSVETVIQAVRSLDPGLATALSGPARSFQYTLILQTIHAAREEIEPRSASTETAS